MPLHIFDASVWIRVSRNHPPDIFVSLWERLDAEIAAGQIRSPDEVLHELEHGDDDLGERLSQWADLFVPLTDDLQAAVARVMSECPTLTEPESDRNRADPFVVALGSSTSGVIVSNEKHRRANSPRMKIPDACDILGLPHVDWFGYLRSQGWRL